MTDDLDLDPALLARYFAGDCSRTEALAFERWIAASPERHAFVAQLRQVWQTKAGAAALIDGEAAWGKITGQLSDYGVEGAVPPLRLEHSARAARFQVLRRSSRMLRRVAIAAGLLVTVGGGTWLGLRHQGLLADDAVYATRQGRKVVILADGSRVTLGPASRLRVLRRPTSRERRVELKGQAFFQVAHNPNRPFLVKTQRAETKVLGTEFLVRAYPDERNVQVGVRSGRVAVRGLPTTREVPVVTAGRWATVADDGAVRLDQASDAAFSWVAGPLRFESTPFGEVAHEVGRWIGLDITVPDSALSTTRVTASFPDLTRDSVLARLVRLSGARPISVRDTMLVLIDMRSGRPQ